MVYSKKIIKVTLFLFTVMGCSSATLISEPGTVDENSATNMVNNPGYVKFLHVGAQSVLREKKEDAKKLMKKTCDGRYSIDKQGLGLLKDNPNPNQYWYYEFRCR